MEPLSSHVVLGRSELGSGAATKSGNQPLIMKRSLIIVCLFSCGLSALDAVPASDARLLYENQSGTADAMRTLSANLSSTEAAIDFLRRIKIEGSYVEDGITIHRGTAVRLLAILGDTATIKEKYDAFLNAKNDTSKARLLNGDLGQILHPQVIAVLGQDVVVADRPWVWTQPHSEHVDSGECDGIPDVRASLSKRVATRRNSRRPIAASTRQRCL